MRRPVNRAIAAGLLLGLLVWPGGRGSAAQPSASPAPVSAQPGTSGDSQQLFEKLFVVLEHPRCMNCHTGEPFPRQGDDSHRHTMNVQRGAADQGAPGLHCSTCHQSMNQVSSGVPGAVGWRLAPIRMKWIGLNAGQLCRALRDPALGAMPPEQMLAHFKTEFVVWGWAAGTDAQGRARATPPMTYAEFIRLTERWITSGAACPP